MPIYEYECNQCHRKMERIRKFSDPPLTICSQCGGKLTQLFSAPAIQFKGTGWYVTDYAHKSFESSGSDGNGGGHSHSQEQSKPESKPVASGTESASKTKTASKAESK